jgi:hypothetical protein
MGKKRSKYSFRDTVAQPIVANNNTNRKGESIQNLLLLTPKSKRFLYLEKIVSLLAGPYRRVLIYCTEICSV